jgi:hypothetical protein
MKLQIQGLKLRTPDRGQEIIAKVGPGETKIVVIEIDSHGYSLSNQEQIRIT